MKALKINLIVFACVLLVSSKCTKEGDFLGAQAIAPSASFKVTAPFQLNTANVDFTNNEVVFGTATFNEKVTGKLTFSGLTSGANRVVDFTASSIDASTYSWRGGHNDVKFFKKGEKVVAKLSFFGSQVAYYDTVVVTEPFSFETPEIQHAEVGNPGPESGATIGNYWWLQPGISFLDSTGSPDGITALQGKKYIRMEGNRRSTGEYIGGASAGQRNDGVFYWNLPKDPDSVWINVFIYGDGNTNTDMLIGIHEADDVGGDNAATGGQDDQYNFLVTTAHQGWKLFSIRYSDLPIGTFLANGNSIREPHRLKIFSFNLQSRGNVGDKSVVRIEMPMITIGGPFDPSKF